MLLASINSAVKTLKRSADGGATWTTITSPTVSLIEQITAGPGSQWLVRNSSTTYVSPDHGDTWSELRISDFWATKPQHVVSDGAGRWMAISWTGTDAGTVGHSTDNGRTWALYTLTAFDPRNLVRLIWHEGRFVAMGGTSDHRDRKAFVCHTTDMVNWTSADLTAVQKGVPPVIHRVTDLHWAGTCWFLSAQVDPRTYGSTTVEPGTNTATVLFRSPGASLTGPWDWVRDAVWSASDPAQKPRLYGYNGASGGLWHDAANDHLYWAIASLYRITGTDISTGTAALATMATSLNNCVDIKGGYLLTNDGIVDHVGTTPGIPAISSGAKTSQVIGGITVVDFRDRLTQHPDGRLTLHSGDKVIEGARGGVWRSFVPPATTTGGTATDPHGGLIGYGGGNVWLTVHPDPASATLQYFRSADDAATWTTVTPATATHQTATYHAGHWYAIIQTPTGRHLYRAADHAEWRQYFVFWAAPVLANIPHTGRLASKDGVLVIHPAGSFLTAGITALSRDGGLTWEDPNETPPAGYTKADYDAAADRWVAVNPALNKYVTKTGSGAWGPPAHIPYDASGLHYWAATVAYSGQKWIINS